MRNHQMVRVQETGRRPLQITVDGRQVDAALGDTVMTALLLDGTHLRRNEFDQAPRAGFCIMGACQDCWVWLADGQRVRACSTPVHAGMIITTSNPLQAWTHTAS